jgi:rubrerythrin
MKYVCPVCGYVYDDADIPWAELPETWKCPLCGAPKADFVPKDAPKPAQSAPAAPLPETDALRELSAIEISALCSNLARGCEKQYLPEQAEAFRALADWFKSRAPRPESVSFDALLEKVGENLRSGYPAAGVVAVAQGDRGAQRALVWSEKVSMILRSLLQRYAQEGERLTAHTGVWVCTICGFVYIGDELPEVCPVCKVPNRKFERIGG